MDNSYCGFAEIIQNSKLKNKYKNSKPKIKQQSILKMKKLLSLALATLATTGALAQQDKPKISVVSDIKFSGYVMSQ